jgi:hypothetical protein
MTADSISGIDADLAEIRANISHGEAQYNPWALAALGAAEALRSEVRRLRSSMTDMADRLEKRADEGDNPSDCRAMGDFADELRAAVNQ